MNPAQLSRVTGQVRYPNSNCIKADQFILKFKHSGCDAKTFSHLAKVCCLRRKNQALKKIVFSQKGESFWNKPISFTFPPPYFSSVAKQCHVTHVQAVLSKANIPSYASLITQPPYAAPKPTFLAFWGLALSSPVSFHISPDRDDSSCPHTAPPVSHSSREAIPKGRTGARAKRKTFAYTCARVIRRQHHPLQNKSAAYESLAKDQGVCHHHPLSYSSPFHAQNISAAVGGAH